MPLFSVCKSGNNLPINPEGDAEMYEEDYG